MSGILPEQKLFVGNLPLNLTEKDLEDMFAPHGRLVECRVAVDKETGRSKGFGFVTMATRAGAQSAMRSLSGTLFPDGRKCNIEISDSKSIGPYKKPSSHYSDSHGDSSSTYKKQSSSSSHYSDSHRAPTLPVLTTKRKRSLFADPLPGERDNSRDR